MPHSNFYGSRSTVDLLKSHDGHRPLGSSTSKLVNTRCLNGRAQRPRTVLVQGKSMLCPTPRKGVARLPAADCGSGSGGTADLVTGYILDQQAEDPVGYRAHSTASGLGDHVQKVNAFFLQMSSHSPKQVTPGAREIAS